MAFVVTARKWRPQKFSEVVGQEHITTTLKNAIKNNRIAHAYLFTGPRGVGKTTTARILAKTLNCLNPVDAEPCNECEMCKAIQSTQSLDIIEIDGASNRGIDEIRTLRDSVKYAPTKGKFKVYIIDEVHMLTKESFNAFLKTLEEPPAHTIFIFATTDVHKVPLTIISRCQRFDFRRIQLDTIKSLLGDIAEKENIKIDDKTLTIIAKKADGALRDAESFFDQVVSFCGNNVEAETVSKMLNLIDEDIYFVLSDAVLQKNFKAVFEVTKTIYENGWNFIDFMDGLLEHFRNIMTVILTGKTDLVEAADVYKAQYVSYAEKFSEGDILRLLNFLNKTNHELRFAQNQKLKLEIALTHLIGLERSATISDIISRLEGSSAGISSEPSNRNYSADPPPAQKKNLIEDRPAASRQPSPQTRGTNHFSSRGNEADDLNGFNDFKSILTKWAGFVDEVSSEKGLIFGPLLKRVKPIEMQGNKIMFSSSDEHDKKVVADQQEYINKKTHEYFGKKLNFIVSVIKSDDSPKPGNGTSSPKNEIREPANPNDPYVKAILEELGGQEIY